MHLSEQQHETLRRQAELLSAERRRKVTMAEVVRELIDWIEKGNHEQD